MTVRTVLVTGASRGLGQALALKFAAGGARVLGTGRDEAALARVAAQCADLPGTFVAHRLDVRDTAAVDDLVAAAGPLDVCVANAAIAEQQPLLETSADDLRRMAEVNVVGAFAVMRAVAVAMVAQGRGRIVAIASDASYRGMQSMAAYAASKHALLGLTRSMTLELAHTGVHVATVFPGNIRTEILGNVTMSEPAAMDPGEAAAAIVAVAEAGPSIGTCELHLQANEAVD